MLLIAAVFSLSLTGCYFFPREEEVLAPPVKEPQKVTYETIDVKRGTIEKVFRCTGIFASSAQKDLSFKDRGGRLKSIPVKIGDTVKKGDTIAELETDTIENDIKLQEITIKKSKIEYDKIKTRIEIEGGGNKSELELAELDLEAAVLRLEGLKKELGQCKLTSVIDGEVVYISDVKLGDMISAYQTIARVADPSQLQLEYSSDERAGDFKVGMKPDIVMGDNNYRGEVVMAPGSMPADAAEELKNTVRIKIDNLPKDISIGASASIKLTLEKLDNVIVLPKQVINTFIGRKFVNVLNNGIREERDVELGIQTDTQVEVVKGLSEGEKIIIR